MQQCSKPAPKGPNTPKLLLVPSLESKTMSQARAGTCVFPLRSDASVLSLGRSCPAEQEVGSDPRGLWKGGSVQDPAGQWSLCGFAKLWLPKEVMSRAALPWLLCQGCLSYCTSAQPGILPPHLVILHCTVKCPSLSVPWNAISGPHAVRQRYKTGVMGCTSCPYASEGR